MENLPKVLITDAVDPLLIRGLENAGYACDYHPKISLEATRAMIAPYTGLIINSKIIVNASFLALAPKLEFIARLGSGLEIIDLQAAREKGVLVHRSPDGNCDAVAEHAIGMLLSLANNLRVADQQVRQKIWQREAMRGWEIMGKTFGILGFGYTGSALARKLAGFDVQVLAYDKYKSGFAAEMPWVKESTLEQIFEQADILSLHLPLTKETNGLVTMEFLQQFQKPIVLINTSRGIIIPTVDLLKALEDGIITGACLDVFENEKPILYTSEQEKQFADLFERTNVIVSPHVAGWTIQSKERLAKLLLNRILTKADLL